MPGEEFLRRLLQHVLPRGFHKVRYYGLFSPRNTSRLRQAQWGLSLQQEKKQTETDAPASKSDDNEQPMDCPHCAEGVMVVISCIRRATRGPPR